ncbi:hypothetical protein SKAU_G00108870 [Synaphobranchus kaupii]|uniref:Uncharacterized protein n=1 Tax=Synaphobranchus kaupii TaxID=118154 RepID=A0A9Q1G0Q0_SYNKA|nr:hypothetical protein SKAU_G00108870 [Synaphobranchus kaupii]
MLQIWAKHTCVGRPFSWGQAGSSGAEGQQAWADAAFKVSRSQSYLAGETKFPHKSGDVCIFLHIVCGVSGRSAKLGQAPGTGPRKRREQRLVLGLLQERREDGGRGESADSSVSTLSSAHGPALTTSPHGPQVTTSGKSAGLHKQHEKFLNSKNPTQTVKSYRHALHYYELAAAFPYAFTRGRRGRRPRSATAALRADLTQRA